MGDSLSDVLKLAGKPSDPENVRFAVHIAVVHANAAGAPGSRYQKLIGKLSRGNLRARSSVRSSDSTIDLILINFLKSIMKAQYQMVVVVRKIHKD